jgi:hypothetical protein
MNNSILDVVHQTATGLRKSEAISEVTMSEFNKLCLQHLAQSELDVQKNRLAAHEKVFDSLRESLLTKSTEPKGVQHGSSNRHEK